MLKPLLKSKSFNLLCYFPIFIENISMKKDTFTALLTDLYSAYNPGYLHYVPELVQKYWNGMEFDSVQNILIKYNHKGKSFYDEKKNTDSYIRKVLGDYDTGNRIFQNERFIDDNDKNKAHENIKDLGKELNDQLSEKIKDIEGSLSDKLKDRETKIDILFKNLEELYQKKSAALQEIVEKNKPEEVPGIYSNVEIRIISNYVDSELNLPNKEVLAGLGVGAYILVRDKDNKPIGLVIKEIYYDCTDAMADKPIIEIIIDKR